jgi:hypothetical protein
MEIQRQNTIDEMYRKGTTIKLRSKPPTPNATMTETRVKKQFPKAIFRT